MTKEKEEFELIDRSANCSTITTPNSKVRFRYPEPKKFWLSDANSRAYIFRLFTCFYAIFIVIAGIVIELSNIIADTEHAEKISIKDLVLGTWLLGGSILFIAYCSYLVHDMHFTIKRRRQSLRNSAMSDGNEPEVLANTSTGSLYLRLGCVVFGIIGVVYYLLIFVICLLGWSSNEGECSAISDILNMMAAVFIFVQMWFVYCNGKIIFTGDGNLARFGLMHLTGTNLWMWLRYILYEEVETIKEIRHVQHANQTKHLAHHHEVLEECKGVLCVFNGYNEFMYTCVVEYSLICAGVAFVFWTNLERLKREQMENKMRKRSILKIDCSRTAEGLFAGFACIIVTIIAIALFNAYATDKNVAQWIFSCTNMIFFLVSTFLVIFAFWRMKYLKFLQEDDDEEDDNAELLDRILLVVGLMGELIFSIGGILSFVNNMTIGLPLIIFITNVLRLIQVTFQSGLLMVAARLRLEENDQHMLRYKPGKQVITMLLMMNCAQFLMNIFEAQKAGINDEMINMYGSYYWAIIVRGCSPLTIFYRFHSSACFAEVWKKTFRPPKKPRNEEERTQL
uniref:Otopetrin-2 n=1 Tax=Caenorhabditis tropicalis TaxID=1561998 RepID=A0A1I7TB90_9PELO